MDPLMHTPCNHGKISERQADDWQPHVHCLGPKCLEAKLRKQTKQTDRPTNSIRFNSIQLYSSTIIEYRHSNVLRVRHKHTQTIAQFDQLQNE
ncbi:hypothetical protein BLOT_009265 [Blomia tropicalis]|nr:hypothetical protein BLOT_009265 [Blomia tropicalis]